MTAINAAAYRRQRAARFPESRGTLQKGNGADPVGTLVST